MGPWSQQLWKCKLKVAILPLTAFYPCKLFCHSTFVCVQNWLICCSAPKYCFGMLIVTVWIVILTMNKMVRSSNLCRQGTKTEAVYIRAANSVDFCIEFKFEFEFSLFCEFEFCQNLSSSFRVQKIK